MNSPLVQPGDPRPSGKHVLETGTDVVRKKIALVEGTLKVCGSIAQLTASGGDSDEYDSYSEHRS